MDTPTPDPYAEAAAIWPGVRLDREVFLQRLADAGAASANGCTRPSELFLAAACLAGDPAALEHFDREYIAQIPQFVAKFRLARAEVEDLQQVVRMRLLAGPRPSLATYTGLGSLEGWVRVVAVRVALDLRAGSTPAQEALDDGALMRLAPDAPSAPDPSIATILDERHRPAVREALNTALLGLSNRDRTVLRMYVVDDVSLDAIAIVYRVHRATVARWLVSIRGDLLKAIRRRLKVDLGASHSSVVSLMRALQFDIQLSLSRILDDEPGGGAS